MLPSRCTLLSVVAGAALGVCLPAVLMAEDPASATSNGRVPAPQALVDQGIAAYQFVRQDAAGTRLWWLLDAEGQPVGSLEHRPPAAVRPPDASAGDRYTLSFKGEVLVLQTSRQRVVVQLGDGPPVAYGYDEEGRQVLPDGANSKEAIEAARPRLQLLALLLDAVLRRPGAKDAAPPPQPNEEAPCTGDWHWQQSWGVFPTRSWACDDATSRLQARCADASAGACGSCCELTPDCDCVCIPDTDIFCTCNRSGKACAPACPPEQQLGAWCSPQHCSIDCVARAKAAVPSDERIIGGNCNFATECQCDAWVNTCKPSDGSRHTYYSGVQECDWPCPPGTPCGGGVCSGSNPQCCFESGCAPSGADCCWDGGYCPSGYNCCDDGTGSCCPGGYRCCWLEDGPMCCSGGGGDTAPGLESPPQTLPRFPKNPAPTAPQSKE
jgi:hypothetical protein